MRIFFGEYTFLQTCAGYWILCIVSFCFWVLSCRDVRHCPIPHLGIEFYLFVSHGVMNERGSMCKFRNAQTSRIQSLYLYFIKIVPFWIRNIRFLIHNSVVFRTATGTAGSYVTGTASWKNGCQNVSYVHRSRKHWKCKN